MAQGSRYERDRSYDQDDERYGRERGGYGRGRDRGYESNQGGGDENRGGRNFGYGRDETGRDQVDDRGQRGYGQYVRDDDESRGGSGGDYGRWQQGESYGRGYGKDRSEQFASDYGPRGRFNQRSSQGSQGYGQGQGGDGNTSSEGAYPRSYNEMYGRDTQSNTGFGHTQSNNQPHSGFGQSGYGGQGYGSQNYGGQGYGGQGYGGQRGQSQSWGQHRGKGPKNYTRSDDRIREDVSDQLTDHAHIDASEIEVNVKDGEVTLTGTVDDRDTKKRAEEAIESLSGVKHVQNNLRVKDQSNMGKTATAALLRVRTSHSRARLEPHDPRQQRSGLTVERALLAGALFLFIHS